jgi:hypothetical protein
MNDFQQNKALVLNFQAELDNASGNVFTAEQVPVTCIAVKIIGLVQSLGQYRKFVKHSPLSGYTAID